MAVTLVFETDTAAKLAAKIHAAAAPLRAQLEQATSSPTSAGPEREDIPAKLRELAALREQGILTTEEFESKKAVMLSRM
jgi:hypothetical protein